LGAALLIGPAGASAQGRLESLLGPDTVAPPSAALVDLTPKPPLAKDLGPERLATDPVALLQFVEANPERMDVNKMDPALVLTLTQVLLRADRTFLAEKLLFQAAAKWPDRTDLARGWARVAISLGRPAAAKARLEKALVAAPGDAVSHYLLGRACVGQQPATPESDACAKKAFETVLELNSAYTDADGVTAKDLRAILARLGAPDR
jgi:predicted Zn-dependent protease